MPGALDKAAPTMLAVSTADNPATIKPRLRRPAVLSALALSVTICGACIHYVMVY
jgi:hypothetical protein